MLKSRKSVLGILGGLLALAVVAMITLTVTSRPAPASAAPAAQATPAQTATDPKVAEYNQLVETFRGSLAKRLGVSEDVLDKAIGGAVSDTTAQMVKNGQLTQSQANRVNEISKDGFKGFTLPLSQNTIQQVAGLMPFGMTELRQMETKVADALKMTTTELEGQLLSGKSLADMANAKGVDLQTLKDTILSTGKDQVKAAVDSGKLTQAQADQALKFAPQMVDKLVNAKMNGQFKQP